MDVDARIQLFDFKKKYQFQTSPGVDRYNMPLYTVQSETPGVPAAQDIGMYPVYQGFLGPMYANGYEITFQTQKDIFFRSWPNIVQQSIVVGRGNGSNGPYTLMIPISPNNALPLNPPIQAIIRGHIDIAGIISTGINQDPPLITNTQIVNLDPFIESMPTTSVTSSVYFTATATDGTNITVADSGQFLSGNANYGLLMNPGNAPLGNTALTGGPAPNYSTTQNTFNYFTGIATNVYFPAAIPAGADINAICNYFQSGLPRCALYYDNTITLRSVPDRQYLIEVDGYLTPAAFFSSTQMIPYAYMSEYIARGAARKMLADTGDWDQFDRYEGLFKEQESLVHIRSQRQWTATRTQTIYAMGDHNGQNGFNNGGATL
jgi:hypothetical protein